MLHVVIISPVFAIDQTDTISVPFLQLYCKELLKQNVALTLICEQYPTCDDYDWHGVRVHTLKRKTPKYLYKFLRTQRLNHTLKTLHQTHPIDIIHNLWFNILGDISAKFARKNKIRHLITLCGQDVLPENKYLAEIEKYAGILVVPSEFQKKKLAERFKTTVNIIPWGIEKIEAKATERKIDIIHCGWINSVKNNLLFLEIILELRKFTPFLKVVICGGGPMFKELQLNVRRMQLQDLIEIKNSIPREEVIELMQQSKMLVHTSNFESFGLVLAEGLACGCSVLSTPVGIAYNDTNIKRCQTKTEFVNEIRSELKQWKDNRSYSNDYSISQTVDGYLRLYS